MYKCLDVQECRYSLFVRNMEHPSKHQGQSLSSRSSLRVKEADASGITGMPKLDEQISTLQVRLQQLKLRQQRSDARKRALDAQRERKAETRRRFLVGAVIQAKVRDGEMDADRLREWLDQGLTRNDDRVLFDLPPKSDLPQKADPPPET